MGSKVQIIYCTNGEYWVLRCFGSYELRERVACRIVTKVRITTKLVV